jgi:RNA polymerase sigma-70 factor (ECF subfamily)
MTAELPNPLTRDRQSNLRPSHDREEEAQVLAGARAGDEQANTVFVRKYAGRMLAVARRFLQTEEDSADAVQDAFLSAFRSLDSFEGNSALGTWLHRIVVNVCLMRLRTRLRRREVGMDDLLPNFDETGRHSRQIRPWDDHALARLTQAEARAHVRACIDRLPDPYREVLVLRDLAELDTEQTAQHLGINPGAVKTRLHRARQALRTLLEPVALGEVRGVATV